MQRLERSKGLNGKADNEMRKENKCKCNTKTMKLRNRDCFNMRKN